MDFSDEQIDRYARHLVLPEIGEDGQAKLLNARVLVIGAGGLGSPVLMYLAAAGVGTLGVVDFDVVDTSNLQRQIVHSTENIGDPKVASAAERLYDLNPEIEVQTHRHTGPVWGYTRSGAWKYREYDYVNRAGSFLYEPSGSVHTLQCIEDQTRVFFHMYGANVNLDANGKVDSVVDGLVTLEFYFAACQAQGLPRPNVLVE